MTAVAIIAWICIAFLVALSLRQLRQASVRPALPGEGINSLSVVLAVHNEAPRVKACLESILRQDHPEFEVIVVDDRSTDNTLAEVQKLSMDDARVRLFRVDSLPAGWQGRLYAQSIGVSHAVGEWLLFLSADQRLASAEFLRAMVAEYERDGRDAVSVLGRFVGKRWWERWWLHPMVNNPILWGPILLTQRLRTGTVWLLGALAMRRSTYAAVGGACAAALCGAGAYDDFGWSRAFSMRGARTAMVYHPALEDHSSWEGFAEFWHGVIRWAAGLFTYRKGGWVTAASCAVVITLSIYCTGRCLSEALSLRLPDLGTIALALIAPTIGVGYCSWDHRRFGLAGLTFFAGFFVLAVLVGATWARIRNRVRWRAQELRIIAELPAKTKRTGAPDARRSSRRTSEDAWSL
jgi:glycosyltransferase involved in cell wall biosynthesis